MMSFFRLAQLVAVGAIATLFVSGCSDPVQPSPVDYILEVNDTTGVTEVDTNAIDGDWPEIAETMRQDIPHVIRQLEGEQMGSEYVSKYISHAVITPYLAAAESAEESQLNAVTFMIGKMGLADSTDDIFNGPGKGTGVFDDDSLEHVWGVLAANPPTDAKAELAAYAYVAEFEYNLALDASRSVTSASAKKYFTIVVAMNKNQFLSAYKQVRTSGVNYVNAFLTDAEFNDVIDDAFVKF